MYTIEKQIKFVAKHRLFTTNEPPDGVEHLHHWKVVVKLTSLTTNQNGYVLDTKIIEQNLQKCLMPVIDSSNFSSLEELKNKNQTMENIAEVLYYKLAPVLITEDNFTIVLKAVKVYKDDDDSGCYEPL